LTISSLTFTPNEKGSSHILGECHPAPMQHEAPYFCMLRSQ
jgi:hypothetical protein